MRQHLMKRSNVCQRNASANVTKTRKHKIFFKKTILKAKCHKQQTYNSKITK